VRIDFFYGGNSMIVGWKRREKRIYLGKAHLPWSIG
jgi:hypothetical protein